MACRVHPAGIRRGRTDDARRFDNSRRDKSLRGQRRRLPRPDVHDGLAAQAWQRGAEAALPAAHRFGRAPATGLRRDRTRRRLRDAQDQDLRPARRRQLRNQRQQDFHLALSTFRHAIAADAHDSVRRSKEKDRRHEPVPGQPARIRRRDQGRTDRDHDQPRHQPAFHRQSDRAPRSAHRRGRQRASITC